MTTITDPRLYYFYECGICEQLHPCQFAGDCRDDENRFVLEDLEVEYGYENVVTVPMDEADDMTTATITQPTAKQPQTRSVCVLTGAEHESAEEAATPTYHPRGKVAPWNKEVKRMFPSCAEFHQAATKFTAEQGKG